MTITVEDRLISMKETIIERNSAGESAFSLCKAYGVSHHSMVDFLKRNGGIVRTRNKTKKDINVVDEVKKHPIFKVFLTWDYVGERM